MISHQINSPFFRFLVFPEMRFHTRRTSACSLLLFVGVVWFWSALKIRYRKGWWILIPGPHCFPSIILIRIRSNRYLAGYPNNLRRRVRVHRFFPEFRPTLSPQYQNLELSALLLTSSKLPFLRTILSLSQFPRSPRQPSPRTNRCTRLLRAGG